MLLYLSIVNYSVGPSSQKISSSPLKVGYTSTEVPGDDVDFPPEQLVDSNGWLIATVTQ